MAGFGRASKSRLCGALWPILVPVGPTRSSNSGFQISRTRDRLEGTLQSTWGSSPRFAISAKIACRLTDRGSNISRRDLAHWSQSETAWPWTTAENSSVRLSGWHPHLGDLSRSPEPVIRLHSLQGTGGRSVRLGLCPKHHQAAFRKRHLFFCRFRSVDVPSWSIRNPEGQSPGHLGRSVLQTIAPSAWPRKRTFLHPPSPHVMCATNTSASPSKADDLQMTPSAYSAWRIRPRIKSLPTSAAPSCLKDRDTRPQITVPRLVVGVRFALPLLSTRF